MKYRKTLICAIPAECWDFRKPAPAPWHELQSILRRCMTCHRRIPKGVNRDRELKIYQSLLSELSQWLLAGRVSTKVARKPRKMLAAGKLPALSLDGSWHQFLSLVQEHESSPMGLEHPQALGARIIPPDSVKNHVRRIKDYLSRCSHPEKLKARQAFIRSCVGGKLPGFVELPVPGLDDGEPEQHITPVVERESLLKRLLNWIKSFFVQPEPESEAPTARPLWEEYGPESGNRGEFLRSTLNRQIETALHYPRESVNLGNFRHPLVTDALSQFLVRRGGQKTTQRIRITHSDGSTGEPFPLFVVQPYADTWRSVRDLHIGLISMRHLPLDREIDFYWFTNEEVPARGAGAAAERYCFQASLTKLKALHTAYKGQTIRIYMYHTGFLPAVMGFYRSVATVLEESGNRDPWLRVVPVFGPKDTQNPSDSFGQSWPVGIAESQSAGVGNG